MQWIGQRKEKASGKSAKENEEWKKQRNLCRFYKRRKSETEGHEKCSNGGKERERE